VSDLVATIDTSVLISLQSADLLGAVSVLFNRLLVPVSVRKELTDGGERSASALKAIDEFAIFERCDVYDRAAVDFLLQARKQRKEGKDKGEAEAVIQAAQYPAQMVLTDDGLGREWAEMHARECHGTIWICYQLRRTGFLDGLRIYFVRMLDLGRRLPLASMNGYLEEFGEVPISKQEYEECLDKTRKN
jgi:predicted nucleic acid-binding protein